MTAATTPAQAEHDQQPSRLLALPAELQLLIYEFAVTEATPLLLNCGCDSAYPGDEDQLEADTKAWESGAKHPPLQPPVTLTCASIRADALPMFYKLNTFHAHYCYAASFSTALRWFEMIGAGNRRLLGEGRVVLVDENYSYDDFSPSELTVARWKLSKLAATVGDVEEAKECCWHPVTFDEGQGVEFEGLEEMFQEEAC